VKLKKDVELEIREFIYANLRNFKLDLAQIRDADLKEISRDIILNLEEEFLDFKSESELRFLINGFNKMLEMHGDILDNFDDDYDVSIAKNINRKTLFLMKDCIKYINKDNNRTGSFFKLIEAVSGIVNILKSAI
jgi:hypothetical protein